ncbi:hypothetical protein V6N12_032983 [Hibiscus sabdariffa]|uniref:Uncharacterized protein n=1 Tax=Hibiscus sabdariffa TaxID=183260 RepID=A0ABR2AKQ6_9ROSI
MENPSAVVSLNVDTGELGNHGSRPPDNIIALDGPTTLERPRSSSATQFQPSRKMVYGSRFDVLADVLDHNDDGMNQAPTNNNIRKAISEVNTDLPHDRIGRVVPTDTRLQQHTEVLARQQIVEVLSSSERPRKSDTSAVDAGSVGLQTGTREVALVGKVIAAKTSVNTSKNVAVQVLEPGMNSGSKEIKGRILPNALKDGSSNINTKTPEINSIVKQLGPKQKKREDRGVGKPSLASGLSKLVEDLNNAEVLEIARIGSASSTIQGVDALVNWIPNSTFEQYDSTEMQV